MSKIIPFILLITAGICAAQSEGAKTLVLENDEGEKRVRRPRDAMAMPTSEFLLKVTPQNSGSKHLVLGTEIIPPGGVIPRHRHLGQDEILLIQTGSARVTLNDQEYNVLAGSTIFFPAHTWVSLKNTGKEDIRLVFIFSAPGFENYMRCTSVPAGDPAKPLTAEEVKACAHEGHVEYEALASVSAATLPQASSSETQVRRAVESFYTAFNAHDFTDAVRFTTEDWTHINPLGGVTRGRDAVVAELKEVHSTFLKGVKDIPEGISVTFASPDVAVATVVSRVSPFTTPDGVKHENEQLVRTFVLLNRGGRWLISQDQNTIRPGP
ncbi:MAG: SgcJ/EcaC family oxidoreductase [Acidobacteriales bacterium]|nr:SgcJ/EcaC family oxidoreductase [Terriglobales bacterium]